MLSKSLNLLRRVPNKTKLDPFSVFSKLNNIQSNSFSSSSYPKNDSAPTPWYLDPQESPSVTSPLKQIVLPDLPEYHPQTLENLVVYLANELGIDDLIVFDMRDKINDKLTEGAHAMSDFMIIGTGKSPKHLQKASSELDFYIKHNLHKLPSTEGILKSGALAKYHRRLQRKGKKAPGYSKHTYGVSPNTWVMTDTKTDGIIIHMLTQERRLDLNLEYLWSNDQDKSKYEQSRSSSTSDDIFKGIRYFHTSAIRQNSFDKFDINFNNYSDHFQCLSRSHLVDYNTTPLSKLKDHVNLMYSAGLNLDYNLLSLYFKTILESDEFHKDLKSNAEVFRNRERFIHSLLDNYNINLTTEEILKFLSLLIISGSGFNNESFLTLKKIMKTFNIQHENLHEYSKTINQINLLSERITNTLNKEHRSLKRDIDSLMLTVFANRSNWIHFFQVLDSAIKRNDLALVQASLPLVAVCADLMTASEFEQKFLPLIIEKGFSEGTERFADLLYDKTHPN
jgi:ribosomal silencing factor RsfS